MRARAAAWSRWSGTFRAHFTDVDIVGRGLIYPVDRVRGLDIAEFTGRRLAVVSSPLLRGAAKCRLVRRAGCANLGPEPDRQ